MGAGALTDGGAMAVEGALAEAKHALAAAQAVGGQAELGVLDAHVGAALGHLVQVHGVVVVELRVEDEQLVGVVAGAGLVGAAVQGPGEHGHGPLAQAHGVLGIAVAEEEGQEARRHVPVEAQVHVLEGVHGGVLESWEVDDGGEEVQADDIGAEGAELVRACCLEGAVDEGGEPASLVEPENKHLEHIGGLVWEPENRILPVVLAILSRT